MVFDKTGTLTVGRPTLTEIRPLPCSGTDSAELLSIAAALERESTHPIASAINEAASSQGVPSKLYPDKTVSIAAGPVLFLEDLSCIPSCKPFLAEAGVLKQQVPGEMRHMKASWLVVSLHCCLTAYPTVRRSPGSDCGAGQ